MGIAANVARRGAVYYWRKRLPPAWSTQIKRSHVKMSLETRCPEEARFLAAGLNAKAAEVLMSPIATLTHEQLARIFRDTRDAHTQKLASLVDFERAEDDFDAEEAERNDQLMGEAYRLFARKGLNASVSDADRQTLAEAGQDEGWIARFETIVEQMKATGQARPSQAKIEAAIESAGGTVRGATVAMARPVYMQALGDALSDTGARYGAPMPDEPPSATVLSKEKEHGPEEGGADGGHNVIVGPCNEDVLNGLLIIDGFDRLHDDRSPRVPAPPPPRARRLLSTTSCSKADGRLSAHCAGIGTAVR